MTIKLPGDVENNLVLSIAEGINRTTPKHDFIFSEDLKWAKEIQAKLPTDAQAKIDRYIGENGLAVFLDSEIDKDRYKSPSLPQFKEGVPITELAMFRDSVGYAKRIVATLKSIPIRYRLTGPLPLTFSEPLIGIWPANVTLPSDIMIATGSSLPDPLPVISGSPYIDSRLFKDVWTGDAEDRLFSDDRLYFTLPMLGYVKGSPSASLNRAYEDYLRAFYGAGNAVGMLGFGSAKTDDRSYVATHDEVTREIIQTERLEEELRKKDYYCSTERWFNRHGSTDELVKTLGIIGTIFKDNIDCRRLFAACIWYYKAKVNARPLDSILQATIAIEVMLGDRKASEGIGLTNLLASRCSYLLGRSSQHREKIASDFKRIYELRSEVVHEGRHVLKISDRETVNIALDLCAAIITRELYIRSSDDPG